MSAVSNWMPDSSDMRDQRRSLFDDDYERARHTNVINKLRTKPLERKVLLMAFSANTLSWMASPLVSARV